MHPQLLLPLLVPLDFLPHPQLVLPSVVPSEVKPHPNCFYHWWSHWNSHCTPNSYPRWSSYLYLRPRDRYLASASALDSVNIGASCNYPILSKSGVTNKGQTEIYGHVGTSPVAATALIGFALVPKNARTTEFLTSTMLSSNMYSASHLPPTPIALGVMALDMQYAYVDAGRLSPDFVEPEAGIFAGSVLTPGIYKRSGVTTIPVDVSITFDGKGNFYAVWIIQIVGYLTIIGDAKFLLANGAKAENIFWAVHGDIAVGTYAHAKGIMLTSNDFLEDRKLLEWSRVCTDSSQSRWMMSISTESPENV